MSALPHPALLYVTAFYQQYDSLVVLYNEKFAKPSLALMGALQENGLISRTQFAEEIEWTWFYLWHHYRAAERAPRRVDDGMWSWCHKPGS